MSRAIQLLGQLNAEFKKRDQDGRPSDYTFRRTVQPIRAELYDLIDSLAAGKIDYSKFESEAMRLLTHGHAQGAYLGRKRAGDFSPFENDDRRFAELVMDRERSFLRRFIDDVRNLRYDDGAGGLDVVPIRARMSLYTHKFRGTANETFVLASPVDLEFAWEMLADEHCNDCPRYAAGGPYKWYELPTYPAAGATQCLTNCKCVLVRSDGIIGFSSVQYPL